MHDVVCVECVWCEAWWGSVACVVYCGVFGGVCMEYVV